MALNKGCKDLTPIDNSIKQYTTNGVIDSEDTNAIAFVNSGTSIAVINGFPLSPGQALSFGTNDRCQQDCTKYQLSFIKTGTQVNSIFVFRGSSAIQFSQINLSSGGSGSSNVNIFDSSGATLSSTSGALNVTDSGAETSLVLIKNSLTLLSGQGGCRVLTTSAALTGQSIKAFQVLSAATITVFKVGGVDQRAAYGLDAASIAAPAYIAVPAGSLITDITITVGQIVIYF